MKGLTQVDPDDSTARRELDIEIARSVMRWPVEPYGLHNGNHDWLDDPVNYPHVEITDDPLPYTGVLLWHNPEANGVYWSPSTSIEAAMEVVEKMWRSGWSIEIVNCGKIGTVATNRTAIWYVRFIEDENDMNNWSAEAETLPEAICRAALAALKAVGAELDGN